MGNTLRDSRVPASRPRRSLRCRRSQPMFATLRTSGRPPLQFRGSSRRRSPESRRAGSGGIREPWSSAHPESRSSVVPPQACPAESMGSRRRNVLVEYRLHPPAQRCRPREPLGTVSLFRCGTRGWSPACFPAGSLAPSSAGSPRVRPRSVPAPRPMREPCLGSPAGIRSAGRRRRRSRSCRRRVRGRRQRPRSGAPRLRHRQGRWRRKE